MAAPNNGLSDVAITRRDFASDFVFGTATSSYQIEGAAAEDGRGPSIWDAFTMKHPGKISDGSNGNQAVDCYHRTKEDVQLLKKLGVTAYRFSISWSRILPSGKVNTGVNQEGINYYNDLINELLDNGITPYVTLFHWDLPAALEDDYYGFLSADIVPDFVEYVELCFWEFGDRVKHWITFNEPWSFCLGGYVLGSFAPGRGAAASDHVEGTNPLTRCHLGEHHHCNDGDPGTEPYIVAHNQLLAHAAAVNLYRTKFKPSQEGQIGITLVSQWYEPLDPNSPDDKEAAERAVDFMFGWFMEPLTFGKYPQKMRNMVGSRLPEFSQQEMNLVKGSFDFLGLNYYTTGYATNDTGPKPEKLSYSTDSRLKYSSERNGVPIGPVAGSPWLSIYPQGLYELLMHVKTKYNPSVIYITENGVDEKMEKDKTVSEARIDQMRMDYLHDHLVTLQRAITGGVNVKGYFAWSFLDNFEWGEGYTVRFGLFYVDFKNGLARYPKKSAIWFRNFLGDKGKSLPKRPIAEVVEAQPVKKSRRS